MFNLDVAIRTALHGHQIVVLIHFRPIHQLADSLFENQVQPNLRAASIPLTKRVRPIHLNVYFSTTLSKVLCCHLANVCNNSSSIDKRRKTRVPLGNIVRAHLASKIIDILKKKMIYLLQARKSSHLNLVNRAALIKFLCPPLGHDFLLPRQLGGVRNV